MPEKISLQATEKRQSTIATPVKLRGFSVYDFKSCEAEVCPTAPDTGIVFDVGGVLLHATSEFHEVGGPTHTTCLTGGGQRLQTVEHFLSAVNALGFDNLLIKVGPGGLPALDFAADKYVSVLLGGGRQEQTEKRFGYMIEEEIRIDGDNGQYAVISPMRGARPSITAVSIFPKPVGIASITYVVEQTDYAKEIAPARSFVASSLDGDSDRWSRVRARFPILPPDPWLSQLVVFDSDKFVTPLRFKDEPGRHKLLDLIGDLSLSGHQIMGDVLVRKPGHKFNCLVAKTLRDMASA